MPIRLKREEKTMAKIEIPSPLRIYTQGNAEVEAAGSSVYQALQHLTQQFPRITPHLFNDNGQLRKFVLIFLNDADIRYIGGLETPVNEESKLKILPSMAGGSSSSE